ncbi:MAG: isoprenyl transferase [Patescibacteria group bacterium]
MNMDKNNIPYHVAIIMDGNRRWAKSRGLKPTEGHQAGYENFKKIAEECRKIGVKILTVFAFSAENWKRPEMEVSFLMDLLFNGIKEQEKFFKENNIRFNVIGQIERLPGFVRNEAERVMAETKDNKKGIINLALNYGGRAEILDAVKKIVKEKLPAEKINEEIFNKYIYTAGQPDPDLIIRTSGEQRLSGFLPWQGVYSEIYFSPKMWPDFHEENLREAIKEYQFRQRRYGQ